MSLITVDQEKCNQCGICVAECPARIIRMDSKEDYPSPTPDFKDVCLKCGHCVTVCPTGALSLDWLSPEDCLLIKQELAVTPEQAEQFLRGRRSIRSFKDKMVPRTILEKLLEIACSAPSAKNQQPWHWIVVQEPAEVRRLAGMVIDWMRTVIQNDPEVAETMGFTRAVACWDEGYERICRGAPHVIVAHADKSWRYGAEDCTLALSLLDLYATSIGLGACWGGYFYKAVNAYPPLFDALGLPSDHLAFGAMMVGYPKFKYQRIPIRNRPRVIWK
ncbi:MAG: nitroreductase family protein [Deltaproteobacteria bacterium]|nr:nitroreductase family protein [Deltaproteobacteria bacterium]